MAEFTKGEWKVNLESGEITVNDSMVIGTIYGAKDYPCCEEDITDECKANAHLIAAAPEMYEACSLILANMKTLSAASLEYKNLFANQMPVLEKALAKAGVTKMRDKTEGDIPEKEQADKQVLRAILDHIESEYETDDPDKTIGFIKDACQKALAKAEAK